MSSESNVRSQPVAFKTDEFMAQVERLIEESGVTKMTAGEFRQLALRALQDLGITASEEDVELQWDEDSAQPLRLFIKTAHRSVH